MNSLWRQHWADRENARRQAEADKAALAWQHDLELIRRYHRLSITAGPAINTSGIKLHHGENLWWTTTGVKLVEMPQTVKLSAPDHNAYSPTSEGVVAMPRGTLRDNGFVAITNQRVLLFGTLGRHEWCFSQLTGVADGTRETVLRVENRRVLCGLGVAPAFVAAFRFQLALALAEYRDDREGFTDHLARLLDRQQFQGPRVPSPAEPGQAPHPLRWALRLGRRLYFGRPGASAVRQLMPAAATAVLLACGLGLAVVPTLDPQAGPPLKGDLGQDAASPTATSPGTPVGMPVAPVGPDSPMTQPRNEPQQNRPSRQGPQAIQPDTPKPEPPSPSPSSSPSGGSTVGLCGAPANPWNFHFCQGGSLIYDPPGSFCSWFPCVADFWREAGGFVVQCQDGRFSGAGGRPAVCRKHAGVRRPLRG